MLHLAIPAAHRTELVHVLRGGDGRITARGRAAVLNSDHRVISDLSQWLSDGQVEWDTTAEVERTATASILDPDGRAGLDSVRVTDTSVRLDRYLQLRRDIWLPTAREWVSIPLFTGPLSGVERDGSTITVAAQGKESLALQPFWQPLSWGKETPRVRVIEEMLRYGAGEWAFNLPPGWRTPLGKAKSVARVIGDDQFTVWQQAKWQAAALGAQLFYDARGVLRARRRPVVPVWSFTEEHLRERPRVAERSRDIINTVSVTGGVPKGGKRPVTATRSLPSDHPWSPAALGRRGVGRRMIEEITDDTLVTKAAAVAAADRRLREHETSTVDMTFDALPVPMLEPQDVFRADAGDVAVTARAHKATFSVTGGLMSIGYVRVYRPRRR